MLTANLNYEEQHSPRLTSIKFQDSNLSPIERVLLSSSGTVQRTLSAFYNSPIHLNLIRNDVEHNPENNYWTISRKIQLSCMDKILCVATSILTITQQDYFDMLVTQGIGLGQFYKLLHVTPVFHLLAYEKTEQRLFRNYELVCPGVISNIHESYPSWIGELDAPRKLIAEAQEVQKL